MLLLCKPWVSVNGPPELLVSVLANALGGGRMLVLREMISQAHAPDGETKRGNWLPKVTQQVGDRDVNPDLSALIALIQRGLQEMLLKLRSNGISCRRTGVRAEGSFRDGGSRSHMVIHIVTRATICPKPTMWQALCTLTLSLILTPVL